MEPPLGFVPLRDAADAVGRKVGGSSWRPLDEIDAADIVGGRNPEVDRVIKMLAERCEAGEIAAAYRSAVGGADSLERGVWGLLCWRNYFDTGTINLDLPLLDDKGRPNANGYTAPCCTREIFVARQDLDRFVKALRPAPRKPAARASKSRIDEVVKSYAASLNGANPSIPGLERFAREAANLTGHRPELIEEYRKVFGHRPRGRPSK